MKHSFGKQRVNMFNFVKGLAQVDYNLCMDTHRIHIIIYTYELVKIVNCCLVDRVGCGRGGD
jgi:hypothetical protein